MVVLGLMTTVMEVFVSDSSCLLPCPLHPLVATIMIIDAAFCLVNATCDLAVARRVKSVVV